MSEFVLNKLSFKKTYIAITGILVMLAALLSVSPAQAAGCTPPSTDYGQISFSSANGNAINIPASGTYRIWTRMAAPDTTNNTYMLDVDGNSCYTVGGSGVPTYAAGATNYFTGVNTNTTQNGNNNSNWIATTTTGSHVDVYLSAGSHNLTLYGDAPGVIIDKLVFSYNTNCVPDNTSPVFGNNCASQDTTPPSVNIQSPGSNASVSNPISVAVYATDDSGTVSQVQVFVDGSTTPAATSTTSSGGVFTLTLPTLTAGTHTLTAKAWDPSGNAATTASATTINVNDTTPPSNVNITNPSPNQTVSGTISLGASASDNVGVTKFAFVVDGGAPINVTTSGQSATGSTSLDTTTLTNGTHTVKVTAYDAAGNSTTSSTVSFTVSNTSGGGGDTTPPSVTITSPTSGSIVAGTSYNVAATVTDASGIKQVVFLVDGVTKSTDTAAPYAYNLDTTTLTPGSHTIGVQATDNSSNHNVSAVITVTVRVTVLADVNRDCKVNFSDISAIIPKLGQTGSGLGAFDVNGDGKINFSDISAIIPKLGQTPC